VSDLLEALFDILGDAMLFMPRGAPFWLFATPVVLSILVCVGVLLLEP
jgi:hypothetical protein